MPGPLPYAGSLPGAGKLGMGLELGLELGLAPEAAPGTAGTGRAAPSPAANSATGSRDPTICCSDQYCVPLRAVSPATRRTRTSPSKSANLQRLMTVCDGIVVGLCWVRDYARRPGRSDAHQPQRKINGLRLGVARSVYHRSKVGCTGAPDPRCAGSQGPWSASAPCDVASTAGPRVQAPRGRQPR